MREHLEYHEEQKGEELILSCVTEDGTWKLILDSGEFYEGGTPALVESPNGNTGTYYCCLDQGMADCDEIPSSVMRWLEQQERKVEAFLEDHE